MLWGFLLAGCLQSVRCLRVGASKPLWAAVCSASCNLRCDAGACACADAGAQGGLMDMHGGCCDPAIHCWIQCIICFACHRIWWHSSQHCCHVHAGGS